VDFLAEDLFEPDEYGFFRVGDEDVAFTSAGWEDTVVGLTRSTTSSLLSGSVLEESLAFEIAP
jgi:hypothetical protein